MSLANKLVLDDISPSLIDPEGVSKGLDRERLAPPDNVDFYSSVNVINLVTKPEQRCAYNREAEKFERHDVTNRVFVVHMIENLDTAYREKMERELFARRTLGAEIVGFAWLREDPAHLGLPERFFDRYTDVVFSKHERSA